MSKSTRAKNGAMERIVAFVRLHPGCTRREILAHLGSDDPHNGMPTYCVNVGLIFKAGPRGSSRFYPTKDQADAADAKVRDEVERRKRHRVMQRHALDNLRKRARRAEDGQRMRNTRPGQMIVQLEPGVTLARDVKITIAPPIRERWA